jgi:murein DD-endopeptidase MepM/ murein hydrolase activator NlpD
MMRKNNFLLLVLYGAAVCLMAGCAVSREGVSPNTRQDYPEPEKIGVYHKVKNGETLWRIAKTYDIAMEDIVRANNIPDVAQVEENQLVFVPGAYAVKEVHRDFSGKEEFSWPVQGKIIKYFHAPLGNVRNKGINIKANPGGKVRASRRGDVVFADVLAGQGHLVIVKHPEGLYSVYGNNAKLLVKLGEQVAKGQDIAQLGETSELAYLHFEIRKNAIEGNPLFYLP